MSFPCGAASGAEMKRFTYRDVSHKRVWMPDTHASHIEGDVHHISSGQNKDLEYSSYNI